jgi:regulator of RNase E activity RraA
MDREERKRLADAFVQLPTGNIVDAMAELGLPCTAVLGLRMLAPGQPAAAGFAVTMKQMQRHSAAREAVLTKHAAVIDSIAGEDDLLVIDAGGRMDVCTGGSILALRAQLRGISGFLVNGCLRDVREIAQSNFPVYFKGSCPVKSSPTLESVAIHEPVEIGGVQIKNGDLVVMDDTGVVVVPPENIPAVLEKARQIKEKEARWVALLREGKTFAEAIAS